MNVKYVFVHNISQKFTEIQSICMARNCTYIDNTALGSATCCLGSGLAMDVFGATIAHRYTQEEVDGWLKKIGFENIVRTISTEEIYRKAFKETSSALSYAIEPSNGPYWFEDWRKENYENLLRRDTYDPGK